jgi:hypothetical protein
MSNIDAGPALTDRQRQVNKWAKDALANQLTTLRTTAQHWQTTVSTIIGLFGAASIIGTDKDLASLKQPFDIWYGAVGLVALVCGAVALHKAALASEGSVVNIPADIEGRVDAYDLVVDDATKRLRCSRWWTWAAVFLLLAANGVRWYAPKNPPPPPAATASAPTKS